MEKENKDNIENTDQMENDSKENNRKNKNRFGRVKAYIKQHPYRILTVMLLCIALFILLRETGVISKHVYEKVENLGEREGVCFDNLLFSYTIGLYNDVSGEQESKYLCIFNTGDIYCFEWAETDPWDEYHYWDDDREHGYDDANWNKADNVVYLGQLSNIATENMIQYVNNYQCYRNHYPSITSFNNEDEQQEEVIYIPGFGMNEENYRWIGYVATLYWHEQPEHYFSKDVIIEFCNINYLGAGRYEKGLIIQKSYEENALAALELFESSLFYYRWVFMCLHNG